MFTRIITISPQGQITIPKIIRRNFTARKFVLEFRDEILMLKPCRVMVKKKNSFVDESRVESILNLTEDQKKIYNIVREASCNADSMVEKTAFDISKINVHLAELEFAGLIHRNKYFHWEMAHG